MFPERLKNLRREADLTQKQVAEKLKVGQNSYSNWEKGIRTPIFPTIEKLAELFNVSPDYLLGKTDSKEVIEDNPLESATVLFRSTIQDFNLTPEQEEQFKKDINTFIEQRRKAFEDRDK